MTDPKRLPVVYAIIDRGRVLYFSTDKEQMEAQADPIFFDPPVRYVPEPARCATCDAAEMLANAVGAYLRRHGRDTNSSMDAALMAYRTAHNQRAKGA
jgi:hypothetical protein